MLRPTATVELIWQDESGDTSATVFNVPIGYTAEQAFNAADVALNACSALTGASIVSIRVRYKWVAPERLSASGSTPIVETGVFFFSTGPSTADGGIVVHAINPAIVLDDGNSAGVGIDLENADVQAFATAVISLPASNPFGDAFVSLFAAYKQSRV